MRKAVPAPLPCFSLEHDPDDRLCRQCEHNGPCARYMGSRAGKVPLTQIDFRFTPDTLIQRNMSLNWKPDLEVIYRDTFARVFGNDPGNSGVLQHQQEIEKCAKAARVTPAQYILIAMVGHQKTWPDITFTAQHLVRGYSQTKIMAWAVAACATYGSADAISISRLTGRKDDALDLGKSMTDSEMRAARWIINWKLHNDGAPYDALFLAKELSLDPNWLAVEPHYEKYVMRHALGAHVREEIFAHRSRVTAVYKEMKRKPKIALAKFMAKESAMPFAVRQVLRPYGVKPDDLLCAHKVVDDSLKFWFWVALAIQHIGLRNWMEKLTGDAAQESF